MVEKRYLPTKPMGPPIDLIFFRFDSNDDGVLTQDEIPPRMWLRVRLADQNGDGKVTVPEVLSGLARGGQTAQAETPSVDQTNLDKLYSAYGYSTNQTVAPNS